MSATAWRGRRRRHARLGGSLRSEGRPLDTGSPERPRRGENVNLLETVRTKEQFLIRGDFLDWTWSSQLWREISEWSEHALLPDEYESELLGCEWLPGIVEVVRSVASREPVTASIQDACNSMIAFLEAAVARTENVWVVL